MDFDFLAERCGRFPRYKLLLDFLFFGSCFLILWVLFGKRKPIRYIFYAIVMILLAKEYIGRTMTMKITEGCVQVDSDGGILNTTQRINMVWCVALTYVVQFVNWFDSTYSFTKALTNATMLSAAQHVVFKTNINHPLPEKFIIISQHLPNNADMLSIMTFVPPGYKIRTLNDFTGGGTISDTTDRILQNIFCYPLYGSSKLTRSDSEIMKREMDQFANEMLYETKPTVYLLWASGRGWDNRIPCGVREFKKGAVFLSHFSNIPVSIVHTRFSSDLTNMACEQSHFFYPSSQHTNTGSYEQFYEKKKNSNHIDTMCNDLFKHYMFMDSQLQKKVLRHDLEQ